MLGRQFVEILIGQGSARLVALLQSKLLVHPLADFFPSLPVNVGQQQVHPEDEQESRGERQAHDDVSHAYLLPSHCNKTRCSNKLADSVAPQAASLVSSSGRIPVARKWPHATRRASSPV